MSGRAGVGEHDVELALLLLDPRKQAIEVVEFGNVALNAVDVSSDRLDGGGKLPVAPAGAKT